MTQVLEPDIDQVLNLTSELLFVGSTLFNMMIATHFVSFTSRQKSDVVLTSGDWVATYAAFLFSP